MKKSKLTWLAVALLSLLLALGLAACTTEGGEPSDTTGATVAGTSEETSPSEETHPDETGASSDTTGDETSADETVAETTVETEPAETGLVLDLNALPAKQIKGLFTHMNQTTVTVETDEDGEQYASIVVSQDGADDPHVTFNASTFARKSGMQTIEVDEYPYIIMKVRQKACSNGSFVMYYFTGDVKGATPGMEVTSGYDLTTEDWQYILFDLSEADSWEGKLNGFRLDFMASAVSAGETFHVAEIQLLKSADDYYRQYDVDWEDKGFEISDEAKAKAEELVDSLKAPNTAYDSYEKENAANEDTSLKLWFDHMYTRAPQSGFTPKDTITYQIQLAKNETEGCQFVLAPETDVTGLKVYVTDFTNASGDTLKTDLHWGYYFNIMDEMIIDPLPPVSYTPEEGMLDWLNGGNAAGEIIDNLQKFNGFDIKAGESQSFVIKATTTAASKPGEYSATLTVVDANGKEVKKATVFAYVWSFDLSDASACKTLMDLGGSGIYVSYYDYGGVLSNDRGENLPVIYYNFLLDYRVNAYSLPYANDDGSFSNEKFLAYLNNPRVQAFQPLGWAKELEPWKVANAYEFLSQNEEWMEKAYFYPVDEPLTVERLDDINNYGQILAENFPGYKLIAPMHVNYAAPDGDFFSYVTGAVNVWCPKTFFFTTFAEWFDNRDLNYGTTPAMEEQLGSLRDRFWAEQEGGDEVWWYVTRSPNDPEITLIINTEAVNIRTLFWQQKLYNVDGFLYYSLNHWTNGSDRYWVSSADKFYNGMDAMHEINNDYPYEVYGSGILIYSGAYFAQTDPVASLRLESVRDGIEDYEYLTMLEEIYGKEVVDAIITTWTTSLGEYSTDTEQFHELRSKLGALLEQALAE